MSGNDVEPVPAARPNVRGELGEYDDIRLDRFIPALITQAAHRLAANNGAAYRDKFGVSLMEWRVLLHLYSRPGSSAAYLSQTIGYNKATISRTVDALSRRKLVGEEANASDARSSHLHLTDQGAALYRKILPAALEQERLLLCKLNPAEAEFLVDLLDRILASLRDESRDYSRRDAPTHRKRAPGRAASD